MRKSLEYIHSVLPIAGVLTTSTWISRNYSWKIIPGSRRIITSQASNRGGRWPRTSVESVGHHFVHHRRTNHVYFTLYNEHVLDLRVAWMQWKVALFLKAFQVWACVNLYWSTPFRITSNTTPHRRTPHIAEKTMRKQTTVENMRPSAQRQPYTWPFITDLFSRVRWDHHVTKQEWHPTLWISPTVCPFFPTRLCHLLSTMWHSGNPAFFEILQ